MKIEIQRNETSQPIEYDNVLNSYTKGPMYCVMFEKEGKRITHKYPLSSIFRVIEECSLDPVMGAVIEYFFGDLPCAIPDFPIVARV